MSQKSTPEESFESFFASLGDLADATKSALETLFKRVEELEETVALQVSIIERIISNLEEQEQAMTLLRKIVTTQGKETDDTQP